MNSAVAAVSKLASLFAHRHFCGVRKPPHRFDRDGRSTGFIFNHERLRPRLLIRILHKILVISKFEVPMEEANTKPIKATVACKNLADFVQHGAVCIGEWWDIVNVWQCGPLNGFYEHFG